ncbi:restriction endonuclease subunit S [Acinetobacter haemolyticus]
MSVPKLRFKEFHGDWSEVKLKKLVTSLDAGVSVNSEDVEVTADDFSVLKTSCVSLGFFNPNERKKVSLEHEIQRLKEPLLDNSLVMNRSNTPLLVGSSAFINKAPLKTYLSDKLWQFKTNENGDIQWLAYYFANESTLTRLRDMATGTSNSMKNITKPDVLNLDLFVPSKSEQTKIASFLSAVDEKVSQLTQKHELLSQYKQGMMKKLFSQQIRFKADDGSEFGEWEDGSLGDITAIQGGYAFQSNSFGKGATKVLRIGDIRNNIFLDCFDGVNSDEIPDARYLVSNDAIVMALSGATFGKLGKIKIGSAYINQRVATFKVNEKTTNEYVYQIMLSKDFFNYIQSIPSASAQPNISNQDVLNFEMLIPCLEEQTKIANFLSSIDQKIEVVAQQIEQVKQWKKGLLQQMFV